MHNLPRHAGVLMRLVIFVAGACLSAGAAAQAPPQGPVPLQKEGATVKISEHVYVIPDFKVGMVPNVGIIVGSRATLVVDPGMGLPNGQVVLREVQKVSQGPDLYIVNTHFHPEHTTGEVAFPPSAKSSSAGESHPHALTDPDVNLSAHPAPIVQPQAVPPSANAQRGAAAVGQSARANGSLGADGLSASCISAWPI